MTIARGIAIAAALLLFCGFAYADECNTVRYVDNNDGTVTDCRTGLIWLKNTRCTDTSGGVYNPGVGLFWSDAVRWASGLGNGLCGLSDGSAAGDWRLPTKAEFMAMVAAARKSGYANPSLTNAAGTAKWTEGNVFNNVYTSYWTSTSSLTSPSNKWFIDTAYGYTYSTGQGNNFYVWPVRGGTSGSFGVLFLQ